MKPLRGATSGAPCHGKQISPGWGLSRVKGNKQEQVWDRGGGQEHGAGRGALLRVRSPRWGCHEPAGLGSQRGQGADVTPVFGTCCGSDGVSVPLWVTASLPSDVDFAVPARNDYLKQQGWCMQRLGAGSCWRWGHAPCPTPQQYPWPCGEHEQKVPWEQLTSAPSQLGSALKTRQPDAMALPACRKPRL